MITRQIVSEKLLDYLNEKISLADLVDWAENCFITGGFAPDEDLDLLTDILMYIAGADRPYFPLTWETISDFLKQLGDPVKIVPLNRTSLSYSQRNRTLRTRRFTQDPTARTGLRRNNKTISRATRRFRAQDVQ